MTTDANPLVEILDRTLREGRSRETRASDAESDRVLELRPLFLARAEFERP